MKGVPVSVLLLLLAATCMASWRQPLSLRQVVSYGLPKTRGGGAPARSYGTARWSGYYPRGGVGGYGSGRGGAGYGRTTYRAPQRRIYHPSQVVGSYGKSAYPTTVQKKGYGYGLGGSSFGKGGYPQSQNQVYATNQGGGAYGQSAYPSSGGGYDGGRGWVGDVEGGGVFGQGGSFPGFKQPKRANPALSNLIRRVVSYGIPIHPRYPRH